MCVCVCERERERSGQDIYVNTLSAMKGPRKNAQKKQKQKLQQSLQSFNRLKRDKIIFSNVK